MTRKVTEHGPQVRDLRALAKRLGVQTAYRDIDGRRRVASAESLVAVLRALGAPLDSVSGAVEALRQQQSLRRLVDPVTVAWAGRLRFAVRVARPIERFDCTVYIEGGETRSYRLVPTSALGSRSFVVRERLPFGYHRAEVDTELGGATTLVISAPRRAPDPGGRVWGVFAPVYALRSHEDWGVGGYTELSRLSQWVAELGGSFVGTLPLLPCFLDDPFDPSPYMPVSRLCWNELYVDPRRTAESTGGAMGSPELSAELEFLRAQRLVDYRRVSALKRHVLSEFAERAYYQTGRRAELERFLAEHPHVEQYARFRATRELRQRPWREWSGDRREVETGTTEATAATFRCYAYAQWMADEQLREAAARGARLYLDLPLGVHPDGYDAWRYREAFADGVSVGAPPDPLAPAGQDWKFAPLHPGAVREDGYAYVRASLRHHLDVAGMLRIDHVMALHRLFWIPRGMPPSDGVYVRYPAEELYAVLILEAHRSGAVVVGEDLGTVPTSVRSAMQRHGLWRTYVLPFEIHQHGGLRPPSEQSVAALNTHDTPTFAAFWNGTDVAHREQLGLVDATGAQRDRLIRSAVRDTLKRALREEGHIRGSGARAALDACLAYLGGSAARCVLFSLEDLWLETDPQNVPGTRDEYPNWRRRMRYDLDEAMQMAEVRSALDRLARA